MADAEVRRQLDVLAVLDERRAPELGQEPEARVAFPGIVLAGRDELRREVAEPAGKAVPGSIFGMAATNSPQVAFVVSGLARKPPSSVQVALRPVPNSSRPPDRMSIEYKGGFRSARVAAARLPGVNRG
jgi:hypothetical protein